MQILLKVFVKEKFYPPELNTEDILGRKDVLR